MLTSLGYTLAFLNPVSLNRPSSSEFWAEEITYAHTAKSLIPFFEQWITKNNHSSADDSHLLMQQQSISSHGSRHATTA